MKKSATPMSLEDCTPVKPANNKGLTPYSLSMGSAPKGSDTRPKGYALS